MEDLNIDLDEYIIEQVDNVERYQKGDKYTEIYNMYLTNKNIILIYEKLTGFLKSENVVEKIPLSNIKMNENKAQVSNVDDIDYGESMKIVFKDGTKDYFVFENTKDIDIWIKAINNAILEKDNNIKENLKSKSKETEVKKDTNVKVVKCPNCGANIKSFEYKCPFCESEIRNVEASNNLNNFSIGLERITSKELPKYHGQESLLKKVIGTDFKNDSEREEFENTAKENRQNEIASYIKNYPISNSREDLLEFMILTASNINPKIDNEDVVQNAWIDKMNQIYKKASITMANSTDLKEIEDIYNKKMKEIKNKKIINKFIMFLLFAICIVMPISFINIFWSISAFLILVIICLFVFNILKKDDIKILQNNQKIIYIISIVLFVIALIFLGIGIKYNHDSHYNPNEENYYNESIEKHNVEINIEFEENILFNRYDVELSVYDQKETLLHGKDKTVIFELPDGTHILKFKNMDEQTYDSIELKVKGDTKVSYKISCHSSEIKIRELSVEYE